MEAACGSHGIEVACGSLGIKGSGVGIKGGGVVMTGVIELHGGEEESVVGKRDKLVEEGGW